MAHTNSTTNYNLPQWIGSDKPTFLGDLNTAFNDIDVQMKANADGIVSADDKAENATTLANDAQSDVDALTLRVTTAEGNIANNTTLIGNNTTSIGNLTSSIETINTQMSNKQNTITGAASTVTSNNLTASRVLVSDSAGKITNSSISDTELSRLSGVTGNIQTQINAVHNWNVVQLNLNSPGSQSTVTIPSIANYKELMFLIIDNNGRIANGLVIPKSLFINQGIELHFNEHTTATGWVDAIHRIEYVSNTSVRVLATTGMSGSWDIYGR